MTCPLVPGSAICWSAGACSSSSGQPEKGRPLFEEALEMGKQLSEDFYAVDAIHMLAILAPPDQGLELNRQAIQMAESSRQEKARGLAGFFV